MIKESILIETKDVINGILASLRNASKFHNSATILYAGDDFQSSLPLATISIEESFKGLQLLRELFTGLTKRDWNRIKMHKYKLGYMEDMVSALNDGELLRKEELEKIGLGPDVTGVNLDAVDMQELIPHIRHDAKIYPWFQKLREFCLYVDWNPSKKEWIQFSKLPKDSQSKLAYYATCEAGFVLLYLFATFEVYVNVIRRGCRSSKMSRVLEKLPFSYTEHRMSENFDSTHYSNLFLEEIDWEKYNVGLEIMQRFMNDEFGV